MHHLFSNNPEFANRILNYVTVPNLVNTCNKHIGSVRQIDSEHFSPIIEATVEFEVNFNDLGFFPTTPPKELEERLKARNTRNIKLENTNKLLLELDKTTKSHDLETIIEIAKEQPQKKLPCRDVYQWPTADNHILYGPKSQIDCNPTIYEGDGLGDLALH